MDSDPIFGWLQRRQERSAGAGRMALVAILAAGFGVAAGSCGQVAKLEEKVEQKIEERREEGVPAMNTGGGADDKSLPTQHDCKEVSRLFAEALVSGEYGAAYELTSDRLKKRMTREEFAAACTDAVAQFGQAEKLGPVVAELTDGLAGAGASDQYGFPQDIPDDDRLAWIHASLALETDGDAILRYYDCWMLIENDGGKARVGHFNFTLGN